MKSTAGEAELALKSSKWLRKHTAWQPASGLSSLMCGETLEENHLKPLVPLNSAFVKIPGISDGIFSCAVHGKDVFFSVGNHSAGQKEALQ